MVAFHAQLANRGKGIRDPGPGGRDLYHHRRAKIMQARRLPPIGHCARQKECGAFVEHDRAGTVDRVHQHAHRGFFRLDRVGIHRDFRFAESLCDQYDPANGCRGVAQVARDHRLHRGIDRVDDIRRLLPVDPDSGFPRHFAQVIADCIAYGMAGFNQEPDDTPIL